MTRCPARKRTRGKEPLWYFSFVFWGPRDSWVWPLAVNTKKEPHSGRPLGLPGTRPGRHVLHAAMSAMLASRRTKARAVIGRPSSLAPNQRRRTSSACPVTSGHVMSPGQSRCASVQPLDVFCEDTQRNKDTGPTLERRELFSNSRIVILKIPQFFTWNT